MNVFVYFYYRNINIYNSPFTFHFKTQISNIASQTFPLLRIIIFHKFSIASKDIASKNTALI